MDISSTFVKKIVNTLCEKPPTDAVVMTKRDILDILGTAVAGRNAEGIVELTKPAR